MPDLRAQAVCAWAATRYNGILDRASMWLSDGEATSLVEILDHKDLGFPFQGFVFQSLSPKR